MTVMQKIKDIEDEQNVYAKVKWNKFKEMMRQKIDQHGKQVVLKQRADDEVDLKDLRIEKLRHLCKLNGLKQKNTDTKDKLYSILKKYKEEFLCKANEAQNLKNKETQERQMDDDNAELDQEIERAKFDLEQDKRELAETECEIQNYDKELERRTLVKSKEEELAAAMNAEILQAKKRRIAATQSRRSYKKVAKHTNSKYRSTKKVLWGPV